MSGSRGCEQKERRSSCADGEPEEPGCQKDLTALTARSLGGALEGVVPVPTARLQSAASNPHQPTAPGGETAGRTTIKQEACPNRNPGPGIRDSINNIIAGSYKVVCSAASVQQSPGNVKSWPARYRFSSRCCNEPSCFTRCWSRSGIRIVRHSSHVGRTEQTRTEPHRLHS